MSIDPSIPPTPPPSIPAVPPPSFTSAPPPPPPSPAALEAAPASAESAPPPPPPPAESSAEPTAVAPAGENTVAFVSYLTLIGFIIAVVINKDAKKNSLGQFHLRQSLALHATMIALAIVGIVVARSGLLSGLVSLAQLVLVIAWVLGFVAALKGEKKAIPYVGDLIQEKLKGVFPG